MVTTIGMFDVSQKTLATVTNFDKKFLPNLNVEGKGN